MHFKHDYGTILLTMRLKQILAVVLIVATFIPGGTAWAQYSSPSYRVEQTFFGTGGELDASSANYRAKEAAGELGVGNGTSPNYQIFAGFNTTDLPYLEFVVTNSNIDLGYLDDTATKTANGTFYVRAWLADGYTVRTQSDPPTNNTGHQLSPMTSTGASATGTEQFGINLVANTSPATFGAGPVQDPDSTFSFGAVAAGYSTPNQYKYNKGDIIASSSSSSSVTIYTVSYIFNIDQATPSGQYNFHHDIVATATY